MNPVSPQMSKQQIKAAIQEEITNLNKRLGILNLRINIISDQIMSRRELTDSVVSSIPPYWKEYNCDLDWPIITLVKFMRAHAGLCHADADMMAITVEEYVGESQMITNRIATLTVALDQLDSNIIIPNLSHNNPLSN